MHKVGAKGVEIAAELGHPKMTIYTILKRFERCGIVEGQKSIGRPWKLSECSIRVVTHTLVTNHKQTLVDITNRSGFDVSTSIVRKALHEVGFYNLVAQKKPFLSDAHRRRRLEFATQHRKWTCEEWKKIIWIEESTFEVGKNL
jgi:predicted transcriptional regulator